jgi:hypothetical protein
MKSKAKKTPTSDQGQSISQQKNPPMVPDKNLLTFPSFTLI